MLRTYIKVSVAFFLLSLSPLRAGHVESDGNRTTIHLKLYDPPHPLIPGTTEHRAEQAVFDAFERRFPLIFAKRYKERYKSDPAKYGDRSWDDVGIALHRFSGLKIEGIGTDSIPLMAIAGGVSPDIIYVNFRQSDTYIQNGFLYPLDKPEDNYITSMTEKELDGYIHPKIWPVVKRPGADGKTHIWAMPKGGVLGRVIIYRKDLLETAGVPYPDNNWTWNDFYEACRKTSDPANGTYGTWFSSGKQESYHWINFLWSAGGSAMSYNPDSGEWRSAFDSTEAATALDFYTRLCSEPWTDKNGKKQFGYAYQDTDGYYKWQQGQIAFMTSYIDEKLFSTINPELVGMIPVPIGPTGIRAAEINSKMQAIFAGITDPVIRDAAWEFLRFTESSEAQEMRTKIMVEGGLGHFINPQILSDFGYDNLIRLAPKGWAEVFDIAIKSGRPEPYGRNCQIVYDIMTTPIQKAREMAFNNELPENPEQRLAILQNILKKGTIEADEKMIGVVSPERMRTRRVLASLLLLAIVTAFTLLMRRTFAAFTPPGHTNTSSLQSIKKQKWAYILLLPAVATILFWQYLPLCIGTRMAFQNFKLMGETHWVGIDNFANLLFDTAWWATVWNSLRYSLLVITLTFLPPVILAVLLQEVPKGKILFRILFYLPAVITGLVVIYLWKSFYEPSEYGVLNALVMQVPAIGHIVAGILLFSILAMFAKRLHMHNCRTASLISLAAGIILMISCWRFALPLLSASSDAWHMGLFNRPDTPSRWLLDPDTAMLCCVLPMVWAGIGPGCLIYLAALKGVSDEFYEAADIDGATFIDKILFIVFPVLRPLLVINFVGIFVNAWKNSAYILAMTGGGANTETAGLHIFYKAYIYQQFSPATAMAWVLGFILIGFTVHQLRILSRLEYKTTGNTD